MARLEVWLVLILLWLIIGSTYITIKIAIDTIPPFLMSGVRYVSSGALLILIYILIHSQNNNYGTNRNQNVQVSRQDSLTRDIGRKQQLLGMHWYLVDRAYWHGASNIFHLVLLHSYFRQFPSGYYYLGK
jgi:hypothetical protein